jgi:hypothetical protein
MSHRAKSRGLTFEGRYSRGLGVLVEIKPDDEYAKMLTMFSPDLGSPLSIFPINLSNLDISNFTTVQDRLDLELKNGRIECDVMFKAYSASSTEAGIIVSCTTFVLTKCIANMINGPHILQLTHVGGPRPGTRLPLMRFSQLHDLRRSSACAS